MTSRSSSPPTPPPGQVVTYDLVTMVTPIQVIRTIDKKQDVKLVEKRNMVLYVRKAEQRWPKAQGLVSAHDALDRVVNQCFIVSFALIAKEPRTQPVKLARVTRPSIIRLMNLDTDYILIQPIVMAISSRMVRIMNIMVDDHPHMYYNLPNFL